MNIVIPMAGRGQRFVDAGFGVPKPMIDVLGRPMYSWAVDGLPLVLADRIVFVCLEEHLDDHGLRADIVDRYGTERVSIVSLPETTAGQAATVLAAGAELAPAAPLLIHNADTIVRTDLETTLPALPREVDGLLNVFEAAGDHWSFARVDDAGRVVETAEKRRISQWASTGLYWFRDTSTFLELAQSAGSDAPAGGEHYVAPLYNRLIARGGDVRIDVALSVDVVGTPAELDQFVARHGAAPDGR